MDFLGTAEVEYGVLARVLLFTQTHRATSYLSSQVAEHWSEFWGPKVSVSLAKQHCNTHLQALANSHAQPHSQNENQH